VVNAPSVTKTNTHTAAVVANTESPPW